MIITVTIAPVLTRHVLLSWLRHNTIVLGSTEAITYSTVHVSS
jgi:hypothetical protein